MKKTFFVVILLFFIFSHARSPDLECLKWFKSSKIKSEAIDCELQCVTLTVGMGTFVCSKQCNLLCKENDNLSLLGKFIYYPGLNPSEKALVQSAPKDAIIVFIQKIKAESSSIRNFPTQKFNDEGDAFRHFIWAGLLTKELGEDKAKAFLDAHEDDKFQPSQEKAMDLANNRGGILAGLKLIKENNFNQKNLEKLCLEELRSGHLSVLNPGLTLPKEPK